MLEEAEETGGCCSDSFPFLDAADVATLREPLPAGCSLPTAFSPLSKSLINSS